jgi:SAM-dependent MidA family methyltransferase
MKLSDDITAQIRQLGPISFHEFMERCLYDSKYGYYTTNCNSIGAEGDFYTSSTLSPVFGVLLAKQLEEMWSHMGRTKFTIVEYGAGTGHLCRDIMNCLESNPAMYSNLRYCIIEKSQRMRNLARKLLNDRVEWYDSISEISPVNGCILSNELLDNFAVHRVVMEKELMEIFVNHQDGFCEFLRPAEPELKAYSSELNIKLPEGFSTEINLGAIDWIKEVSSCLESGYVITIDYGQQSSTMYQPCRSQGTLLCYYKHSVSDSFYEHIGEQDITSFVNFSALSRWGKQYGLRTLGLTDQRHFLTCLGFREQLLNILSGEQDVVIAAQKAVHIARVLLMDMGSKYKVLIQGKNVAQNRLSGLGICPKI